jgi:initiation factor 1A
MNGNFINARIRGAMQKKVWINKNDIVLIQKFEEMTNEDDKGMICHVYYSDEVRELQKKGELPKSLEISEKLNNEKKELEITFNKDEDENS